MYKAPPSFIESCKECGIAEACAQKKWEDIWKKTIDQFLTWLLDSSDLTEVEMEKLKNSFQVVLEKDTEMGIDELIKPILTDAQYTRAMSQLSNLYFENLQICASELPGHSLKKLRNLIDSLKTV